MATNKMSVVTFNVHHSRTDAAIHNDIVSLIGQPAAPDLMGLQEVSQGHYAALDNLPGNWQAWRVPATVGQDGGRQDTSILYNGSTIRLLDQGWEFVSAPQTVEFDADAGGGNVAEKTVTWIRGVHRYTQKEFSLLNTHAIAGIEHNGAPDYRRPQRLSVMAKLMGVLPDMINGRQLRGQTVFVTGDFNVDYDADAQLHDHRFPYYNLGQVGVHASFRDLGVPLSAGRHIDYVCATSNNAKVTPISQKVYTAAEFGSDHDAVGAIYQMTAPPAGSVEGVGMMMGRPA